MAVPERLRLSDEAIANKRRYDQEYIKEHYKHLVIALPIEEYEDLKKTLKNNKLTNVGFIRESLKNLKEKKF